MKTALTIAGSDCSGGAGIQADIKTMTMHGVYAMSVITSLTAQNTMGVYDIVSVSPSFLEEQLRAVYTDISPDAVKIGMVHSEELLKVIIRFLKEYAGGKVVVDPVMVATSGDRLISDRAITVLTEQVFPFADLITPNIPECEVISQKKITSSQDMADAAEYLSKRYGCSVLCKGGHRKDCADDLLYDKGEIYWLKGERIHNENTHGTGCTLSSAIASNLACNMPLVQAVTQAKNYVTNAIKAELDLGKGRGPLNHMWSMK